MTNELPRFGVEVTMADLRDPSSFEAGIKDNTKLLYVETLTNPVLKVCDLEAMAKIAKKHNLISIVDNTFATPWSCNPISMGFDLVINSGTKYLGGHSDLIAGVVVGRADLISQVFDNKTRFGGAPDPHMCYLLERGIRTLHARMPIHAANSAELARRLEQHPMIVSVNHSTLPSFPDYEVAKRIIPKGLVADIDLKKIKIPKIFKWLSKSGVTDKEMLKTFNCGVGFCLVAKRKNISRIKRFFKKKYQPYVIGKIMRGDSLIKLNEKIVWK